MIEKKQLIKRKSDMVIIVLYVVIMTILFMSYCSNINDKTNKSIGCNIHQCYNEDTVSSSENGNTKKKLLLMMLNL